MLSNEAPFSIISMFIFLIILVLYQSKTQIIEFCSFNKTRNRSMKGEKLSTTQLIARRTFY